MDLDTEKIDDAVLALLLLGATGNRAWKGFDWEVMNRLHERGFISNPRTKAQSILLTEGGLGPRPAVAWRVVWTPGLTRRCS